MAHSVQCDVSNLCCLTRSSTQSRSHNILDGKLNRISPKKYLEESYLVSAQQIVAIISYILCA